MPCMANAWSTSSKLVFWKRAAPVGTPASWPYTLLWTQAVPTPAPMNGLMLEFGAMSKMTLAIRVEALNLPSGSPQSGALGLRPTPAVQRPTGWPPPARPSPRTLLMSLGR